MYFLYRRFWATVVCALNVDDPSPVSVQGCLAPGSAGASPADLSVPGTSVKPEPVAPHIDAHLALLTEAVGSKGIDTGAD